MALSGRIKFDPSPSIGSRSIMGPSPRRLSLTFFPPAIGRVTLSNDPVTGDGAGLVLAAGQTPVTLDVDEEGQLVIQGWYALYSAGATGVSWAETLT